MLAGRLMMSGTVSGSQLYTTPGVSTFIVPTGVTEIRATIIGGGGAGGVGIDDGVDTGGGGGGGSGGAIRGTISVVAGNTINVVVGIGGNAGSYSGGQSYIQYLYGSFPQMFAFGGTGGLPYNVSAGYFGDGGAGGGTTRSGTIIDLSTSAGSTGATGGASAAGGNGSNRAAFFGYSGTGGTGDTTGVATIAAMSASGYGAGGGGSRDRTLGSPNEVSGNGVNGVVLLEWGF